MKPDPTPRRPSDWPLDHPWLYIYTVISAMLLGTLALMYALDWITVAHP